jgi:hypothetical protein
MANPTDQRLASSYTLNSTLRTVFGPLGMALGKSSSSSAYDEQAALQHSSFQQLPSSSSDALEAQSSFSQLPGSPRLQRPSALSVMHGEEGDADVGGPSTMTLVRDLLEYPVEPVPHNGGNNCRLLTYFVQCIIVFCDVRTHTKGDGSRVC